MLRGKHVLLGITGGIAAYKTSFLVRLLIKAGAEVKVVMTESAGSFVSPLTLATLSKNPVLTEFVKEEDNTVDWNNHVALGLWADFMIIAPATANSLSKMANGVSDNLLVATYLSAKCPVYVAPAMDLDMYQHPSTKASLDKLESFGNRIIPAESGELASGLEGEGRMAEPEHIIEFIEKDLLSGMPLFGKIVLVTAGPTYEAIDPVRYVGNHASGLMGFEIARRAAELGAEVILVAGPTHLKTGNPRIKRIDVVDAESMYQAVHDHYSSADVAIAAAAVADYRPGEVAGQKLKKKTENLDLKLVKTKDILLSMGENKESQFLVGFALETENEVENAKEKLKKKNLDAIVLNSLNDPGAGFGTPTNKITFIDKNYKLKTFDMKTKAAVAVDIWNEILKRFSA